MRLHSPVYRIQIYYDFRHNVRRLERSRQNKQVRRVSNKEVESSRDYFTRSVDYVKRLSSDNYGNVTFKMRNSFSHLISF